MIKTTHLEQDAETMYWTHIWDIRKYRGNKSLWSYIVEVLGTWLWDRSLLYVIPSIFPVVSLKVGDFIPF